MENTGMACLPVLRNLENRSWEELALTGQPLPPAKLTYDTWATAARSSQTGTANYVEFNFVSNTQKALVTDVIFML